MVQKTATSKQAAFSILKLSGLWRNADFLKLWAAQSVSLFGSEVTLLALPLIAALALRATPAQMGLLAAAGQAPFLLFSLFTGVWVDRVRRRPLLVAADLGRAVLLLSIPVAALLGVLHISQLYVVAFAVGSFSVIFEVAHFAFIPAILRREQLVDGNSKLQISYSVAESAGPGVAGMLVQLLSAPLAVLLDVISFLVSALFLRSIRVVEPQPVQSPANKHVWQEIGAGLRALLGHPLLRPIILTGITSNIFLYGLTAVYVLYATRDLGITPLVLGLVFAAGGLGAVPGAILSRRVVQRYGVGPTIIGGWMLEGLALLLVPLAAGPWSVALLVVSQVLRGVSGTIANIHQWSLRQAVTPDELQGRVTASHRFLVYGAMPFGSLMGGLLASAIGLRPTLLICAVGVTLAPLWAVWSPLRKLREQPGSRM